MADWIERLIDLVSGGGKAGLPKGGTVKSASRMLRSELVGEAGPEAVVPTSRAPSLGIGVKQRPPSSDTGWRFGHDTYDPYDLSQLRGPRRESPDRLSSQALSYAQMVILDRLEVELDRASLHHESYRQVHEAQAREAARATLRLVEAGLKAIGPAIDRMGVAMAGARGGDEGAAKKNR